MIDAKNYTITVQATVIIAVLRRLEAMPERTKEDELYLEEVKNALREIIAKAEDREQHWTKMVQMDEDEEIPF